MSAIQNLRKSLVRSWEPVCRLVGGAISGAEFAPFPSSRLLPPGDGPVCSRLAPLWYSLSPSFWEWVGSAQVQGFSQVNSLSLAIPPFKLLSHVSSLRLPSGPSGPVLTLSNAPRSSPFCPHLLVTDVGVWGTFLLGVAFRYVICDFYLFFLPVRLSSEI